jgi:hypothetical protein
MAEAVPASFLAVVRQDQVLLLAVQKHTEDGDIFLWVFRESSG